MSASAPARMARIGPRRPARRAPGTQYRAGAATRSYRGSNTGPADERSNREFEGAHEGWAHADLKEGIHAPRRAWGYGKGRALTVAQLLAARRETMPEDPNGAIYDYFAGN